MLWFSVGGRPDVTWVFLLWLPFVGSSARRSTHLKVEVGKWSTLGYPESSWAMRNPSEPFSVYTVYRQHYANNIHIDWFLEGPTNSTVILQVLRVSAEECCDFLTVYSGDRILKTYNGTYNQDSFLYSSGNLMKINFESDKSTADYGFLLRYTATEPCSREVTEESASFASSNLIVGIHHDSCEIQIKTAEHSSIELFFEHLQLEYGSTLTITAERSNVTISYEFVLPSMTPFVFADNQLTLHLYGPGKYRGVYSTFIWGNCGFNISMCGWKSVDVLHAWKRSETGNVSFEEIPGYTLRGYRALLQSPRLGSETGQEKCLALSYHMHGTDVFELSVYIMTYMNDTSSDLSGGERVWQQYGESSRKPKAEVIRYVANGSYTILLEAVRGYGPDYKFIVDGIKLLENCPQEPSTRDTLNCTLDDDLCSWRQSRQGNNNWQFEYDTEIGYLTASFGYKSEREGERTSILESPFLSPSEPLDLGFYYLLQGESCLIVQLVDSTMVRILWSRCAAGSNDWIPNTVAIPAVYDNSTKLQFVARLRTDADLTRLDQLTVGKRLPGNFSVWECDFSQSLCGLRQGDDNTADWVVEATTADVGADHYPSFFQFRCGSGLLIPISWRCDFSKDCPDGADEVGCGSCPSYLFRCPHAPQTCIPKSEICNGHSYSVKQKEGRTQCGEEQICVRSGSPCSEHQFVCNDHHRYSQQRCTEAKELWNGRGDCSDDSDEKDRRMFLNCRDRSTKRMLPSDLLQHTGSLCPEVECPHTRQCVAYACLCKQGCGDKPINRVCHGSMTVGPTKSARVKLIHERQNIMHTASLHTAEITLQQPEYLCVSFQYLMRGVDEEHGTATLRLNRNIGEESLTLWGQAGDKSDDWLKVAVVVPFTRPENFTLTFESQITGTMTNMKVALRDLAIERGYMTGHAPSPCSELLLEDTNFQDTFGIWYTDHLNIKEGKETASETPQPQHSSHWTLAKSVRDMRHTGPVLPPRMSTMNGKMAEHLLADAAVFGNIPTDGYLLCNSSKGGGSSYLQSLPVPSSKGLCIKFLYFMYGQNESALSIGVPDEELTFKSLFALPWSMSDSWQEAEVSIDGQLLKNATKIMLQCKVSSNTNADIALDNIQVMKHSCGPNKHDVTLDDIITAMQQLLAESENLAE